MKDKKEIKIVKIYYWNDGGETFAQICYNNGYEQVKRMSIREILKLSKQNGVNAEKE